MKKYTSFLILLYVLLAAVACRKEADLTEQVDNMNFNTGNHVPTEIDNWLEQNFVVPYNIQVKYHWDRSELALNKSITPVDEERVIPVGKTILKYFLDPYKAEAGENFIKTYPPKQYLLIGSEEYNSNGTVTVGSAEAGRKIVLYRLNQFDTSNIPVLQRMLKTVHHEFGHIMNQNRMYNSEYQTISQADYVGDTWADNSLQTALNAGMITPYAMSEPNEDFVEMVAVLLVYGQEYFDNLVSQASASGAERLRHKERMVVDYYQEIWNIDFRSLQQRIQALMPVPPPPNLADNFGPGKTYDEFTYDPTDASIVVSPAFATVFSNFRTDLLTYGGRDLQYLIFVFEDGNSLRIRNYYLSSGSLSNASVYLNVVYGAEGKITFDTPTSSNSSVLSRSTSLIDFLTTHEFKLGYQGSNLSYGGLYVIGEESTKWLTGALK